MGRPHLALPAVTAVPVASATVYLTDAADGLITGAVFGILAMGVVTIHRTTRTLNLAQGGMATLGALLWITLRDHDVPLVVAVPAVVATGAVAGALIGVLLGWPLRSAPPATKLVAGVGLLLVTQSAVTLLFGNTSRPAPPIVSGGSVAIDGVHVGVDGLVALAAALGIAVLLRGLFNRTQLGLYMRAVAIDPQAAELQGVNVRLVIAASWAVGVGLALGGGVLLGPALQVVAPLLLTLVALQAIGATLVGDVESLPAALLGGLIIGELVTFAQELFPDLVGGGDIAVLLLVLGAVVLRNRRPALRGRPA